MGGESRIGKLRNWLYFWNRSKLLWSNAYAPKGLTETNLSEPHQSTFSKTNQLTDLDLSTGVSFEVAEFLKQKQKLQLLTRGKYLGQGPSRKTLEIRELEKKVQQIKDTPFTSDDLRSMFLEMGLPYLTGVETELTRGQSSNMEEISSFSPIKLFTKRNITPSYIILSNTMLLRVLFYYFQNMHINLEN